MKNQSSKKLSASKDNWKADKQELIRLQEDIFRPDHEKFRLFTQMLRRNSMLNKAIISHK